MKHAWCSINRGGIPLDILGIVLSLSLGLTGAVLPAWAETLEETSPLMQRYRQYGQLYGADVLLQAAIDSLEAREYPQARVAFQALLSLDPKSAEAAYYLGRIAYEMGDISGALRYFRQAHQLSPELEKRASSVQPISATTREDSVASLKPNPSPTLPSQGWVSVTGKPLRSEMASPQGPPVLVKLLDPRLKLFTEDGWLLPPSDSLSGIYELKPGERYVLKRTQAPSARTWPIYLGALGAAFAVMMLAN